MSTGFSYKIRELEIADVPMVVELGHQSFTDETLPLLHQTWGEAEVLNNYTSEPEFCLVAESRKKIIGFTLGTLMMPAQPTRTIKPYGWLLWIAVSARHQGNGIAGKLTDKLAQRFKRAGAAFILANSDETNETAVNFFRTNQFDGTARHVYLTRKL